MGRIRRWPISSQVTSVPAPFTKRRTAASLSAVSPWAKRRQKRLRRQRSRSSLNFSQQTSRRFNSDLLLVLFSPTIAKPCKGEPDTLSNPREEPVFTDVLLYGAG